MRVLVTGGAGFIGSTTAELLLDRGDEVIVLDNLVGAPSSNVPVRATFVEGDVGDVDLVSSLGRIDACVHFAGSIAPAESMRAPELFFANNVAQTMVLLETLIKMGTPRFVFSSSCAVYGDEVTVPIDESHPTAPHSPYGESKLAVERALGWLSSLGRISSASLRYFNAAGGTPEHPEQHVGEFHLIPLALAAAAGDRVGLDLYGTDYPTRDGTCVRDYIHVADLASAHALAVDALAESRQLTLNLGTGTGYSNREVIDTVMRVTGRRFDVREVARRPGDPAEAVASNELARSTLGWTLGRSGLDEIVDDAWRAYQVGPSAK
jgi:UDP-glucose 4-epimerase